MPFHSSVTQNALIPYCCKTDKRIWLGRSDADDINVNIRMRAQSGASLEQ